MIANKRLVCQKITWIKLIVLPDLASGRVYLADWSCSKLEKCALKNLKMLNLTSLRIANTALTSIFYSTAEKSIATWAF